MSPILTLAQQRVLEKSEHTLEFGNGPMVLTVRSSPGPHTHSDYSVSPKLDLTGSSQVSVETFVSSLSKCYKVDMKKNYNIM